MGKAERDKDYNQFREGQMVKIVRPRYSKGDDYTAYGVIRYIRKVAGIAYIQFLPICNMDDCWVSFASMTLVH